MEASLKYPDKILFFDGECNLCNAFVNFMIHHQNEVKIYMAPLQGPTAQAMLEDISLQSVVYYREEQVFMLSKAAILAVSDLGGLWSLTKVLLIIPRFLRDPVYRTVAKNRYRLFGRQICRIPTKKETDYFLS